MHQTQLTRLHSCLPLALVIGVISMFICDTHYVVAQDKVDSKAANDSDAEQAVNVD